ncbi:MAG: DNA repair protein RecO [Phycisphaerae bacterium]
MTKETVQDEVVCLSRREFSETSQVLVFISRSHGKISLLAKGSKRPRGKTAGGIDLLDTGQADFIISSEGLGLLKEFLPGKPWLAIRKNIKKWYAALYAVEVVNISTKELEPIKEIFDLLTDSLDCLSAAGSDLELAEILVNTLMRLLSAIGYRPELQRCVNCKRQMTPSDWLFFSASGGGVVCRDCEPGILEKIRFEHRAWYFLLGKVHDLISASKAFDILNYMLREHLGKTPAMASYCRGIFLMDRKSPEKTITKM